MNHFRLPSVVVHAPRVLIPSGYKPKAPSHTKTILKTFAHGLERILIACVLLLIAPLLTAVTLLLVLVGQPPIFAQERVGRFGKPFRILKFRTIPDGGWDVAATRSAQSPIARLRLKAFGQLSAVMRATGIDELPQFINILRGEMRLIGPRPLMREDYLELPEPRLARCVVHPGITGLAQVNGGQALDPHSKLALDLYFIERASPGIYAEIVWRSICRITGITAAVTTTKESHLERARKHFSENVHGTRGAIQVAIQAA